MAKKFFSLALAVLFILCAFLLVACNETESPEIEDTTPPETVPPELVPDAEKNKSEYILIDYTYRYGDQYYVRTEFNADGDPLREEYYKFFSMELEFSVIYTYNSFGRAIDIKVDYNDRTLPDEKIEPEYNEDSKLTKISWYRNGADRPTHEIVYERAVSGAIKKETRYRYGVEISYAEYGEDGKKSYEKGRADSAIGVYELIFAYNEVGSVAAVNTTGYNYREELTFSYVPGDPYVPSNINIKMGGVLGSIINIAMHATFDENGRCVYYYHRLDQERNYYYSYNEEGFQCLTMETLGIEINEYIYNKDFTLSRLREYSNDGFMGSGKSSSETKYEYDEKGFVLKKTYTVYSSGKKSMEKEYLYRYDLDEYGYVRKSDDGVTVHEYDEWGNEIKTTYEDGSVSVAYYDENNVLVKKEETFILSQTKQTVVIEDFDDSRVITYTSYDMDGNFKERRIYTYKRKNSSGKIMREIEYQYS